MVLASKIEEALVVSEPERRRHGKSLRQPECLCRIASTRGFPGEAVVGSSAPPEMRIIVRGRLVASRKHSRKASEKRSIGATFGHQDSARAQKARLVTRGLRLSRQHRPQLYGRC